MGAHALRYLGCQSHCCPLLLNGTMDRHNSPFVYGRLNSIVKKKKKKDLIERDRVCKGHDYNLVCIVESKWCSALNVA